MSAIEKIGGATLYLGDCLEVMPQMNPNSVDLTVTSPPYDNLRSYEGSLDWDETIWRCVIEGLWRVTAEGGVVVWVVGDATIKGSETGTSFKQALYFKEVGFNLHDTMIYQKPATHYAPKCQRYWQAFEYMFVLSKGKPSCNYITEPCKDAGKKKAGDYGQKRYDGSNLTDRHNSERIIKDHKVKDNIWFYTAGSRVKGHPAPFSEALANDHVISWSNPGDVVFDPFMGSGTTGKAALLNSRQFIGIEKVEKYFEISCNRLKECVS